MNTRHKELELSNFMQNKECHNLIKLLWVLMKLIHPTIGERKNIISPPLTLFVQYMHNIQTIQIYLITNLHLQLYRIFYLWSYIWLFKRIPIFWFNHFMLVGVVQFQLNSFIQHSTCQNVTITCDVFFQGRLNFYFSGMHFNFRKKLQQTKTCVAGKSYIHEPIQVDPSCI